MDQKNTKDKDADDAACKKNDEFVLFGKNHKVQINELFFSEVRSCSGKLFSLVLQMQAEDFVKC